MLVEEARTIGLIVTAERPAPPSPETVRTAHTTPSELLPECSREEILAQALNRSAARARRWALETLGALA